MKNRKNVRKMLAILISVMTIASMMISASVTASAADVTGTKTAEAVSENYDISDATSFVFSDSGITVTEGAYSGYKISGTSLTIKESGTYVVSGACASGTIVVKKNVTGVALVLNGLTLSASATAPITCNKGSEVTIVAAAGAVNNLADDTYNNDDVYTDEELYPDIENAVIKCKDGSNVTICGTGTINITANGKNGVKGGGDLYEEDEDGNATDTLISTASLTIREVTLNITANVNDGLKSDKELNIFSGNITVAAADDGIKCDYVMNVGAEGTDGPTVNVTEAAEGIEAATLNVYSGNITINATDDGINAANSDLDRYNFSYNQYGGCVVVNVTNGDGIDSNGTIDLYGGTLEVYSPAQGDGDPLDSESGTYFKGATVLAVGHLGMPHGYGATAPYVTFGSTAGVMGGRPGGFGDTQTNLVTAGSTITVTDASGAVLYTAKAVRNASYVLFSSPDLTSGTTYTLKNGTTAAATATAGTASAGETGGQMPGNNGSGGLPQMPGNRPGNQGQIPGMNGRRDGDYPDRDPKNSDETSSPPETGEGTVSDHESPVTFKDVEADAYYADAVAWAVASNITEGTSAATFSPDECCTRAQVVTFLWRAAGQPEPTGTDNPFEDVNADDYFCKAALWAIENGITLGTSSTTFSPDETCTREQIVTFLWRANGQPEPNDSVNPFVDVNTDDYFYTAVIWAVEKSITNGTDATHFSPNATCTRGQVATFLYRAMKE